MSASRSLPRLKRRLLMAEVILSPEHAQSYRSMLNAMRYPPDRAAVKEAASVLTSMLPVRDGLDAKSLSLEAISAYYGQNNWDTFSANLPTAPQTPAAVGNVILKIRDHVQKHNEIRLGKAVLRDGVLYVHATDKKLLVKTRQDVAALVLVTQARLVTFVEDALGTGPMMRPTPYPLVSEVHVVPGNDVMTSSIRYVAAVHAADGKGNDAEVSEHALTLAGWLLVARLVAVNRPDLAGSEGNKIAKFICGILQNDALTTEEWLVEHELAQDFQDSREVLETVDTGIKDNGLTFKPYISLHITWPRGHEHLIHSIYEMAKNACMDIYMEMDTDHITFWGRTAGIKIHKKGMGDRVLKEVEVCLESILGANLNYYLDISGYGFRCMKIGKTGIFRLVRTSPLTR